MTTAEQPRTPSKAPSGGIFQLPLSGAPRTPIGNRHLFENASSSRESPSPSSRGRHQRSGSILSVNGQGFGGQSMPIDLEAGSNVGGYAGSAIEDIKPDVSAFGRASVAPSSALHRDPREGSVTPSESASQVSRHSASNSNSNSNSANNSPSNGAGAAFSFPLPFARARSQSVSRSVSRGPTASVVPGGGAGNNDDPFIDPADDGTGSVITGRKRAASTFSDVSTIFATGAGKKRRMNGGGVGGSGGGSPTVERGGGAATVTTIEVVKPLHSEKKVACMLASEIVKMMKEKDPDYIKMQAGFEGFKDPDAFVQYLVAQLRATANETEAVKKPDDQAGAESDAE